MLGNVECLVLLCCCYALKVEFLNSSTKVYIFLYQDKQKMSPTGINLHLKDDTYMRTQTAKAKISHSAKSSPIGAFNVMCQETLEFLCSVVGYTCRIQLQ